MTTMQTEHARKIVNHFRETLSESGRQHIGQKHFSDLELMIESALDAVVVDSLEHYAQQLEKLAG